MGSRTSAPRLGAAGIVILVLTLACRRDAAAPLDEDLVDYAGCEEVWLEAHPRCLFRHDVPLRLWITRPNASGLSVRVDGNVVTATVDHASVMTGIRLEVTLPRGAETLVVELADPPASWSLPLREWSDGVEAPDGTSTSRVVDDALARSFEAESPTAALADLDAVETLAERYPEGRAELATYRGIAYWRQGRYHDAATLLAEGVLFAMRTHDPELILEAIPLYAAALTELGYWGAAASWSEQVLALMESEPELFPCIERARIMSTLGYAHLLFARYQGRPSERARSMLEQALASMSAASECSDPSSVPAVTLSLADEALDRRDPSAVLALLERIDIAAAPTADQRLRLRDAELRALDALGHPLPELERALARLQREVETAGLAEGRWRLALRRGDLLVRQGRIDEAIESYQEAEDEALAIATLAAVGLGRELAVTLHAESTERLVSLLAQQGRADEALCAAREAQARRIQGVASAPMTLEQRQVLDAAIEEYHASQRALDEAFSKEHLLPREERETLHLTATRREQALARLANEILVAQSRWHPSCEDLVPRRDGELLLGLYPASDGWFVFVQDESGTERHWIAGGPRRALDDPHLGAELLEPASKRIAAAERIRVLASGRAQDIDVHLLSWRGAPLIEHLPVAYGAELPRTSSVRDTKETPRALLVADPTESLPRAEAEVRSAAEWLSNRGWEVKVLGVDDADREQVEAALDEVSFFYFAGHGVHAPGIAPERSLPPYAGGSEGWPAHLRLKGGTKLEIQNVLMLGPAPSRVALLGCETGVPGSSGGGMSLALAFLVAGTQEVVATPVEATEEGSMATGLGLLRGMSGGEVDLAAGLRAAQRAMLQRGIPVERYRVWVR